MTFLVTGATGKAGRHVVDQLLEAGAPVRALTRDPERAALPDAVEVVRGDLQDPGSLEAAFAGVSAAHLLTSGGDDYATLTGGPQLAALAERAGVRRVTLLWSGFTGPVEAAFEATAIAWTRLEPGNFMGNARFWHVEPDGAVREPYPDTPDAPVHEADVGAVAAHVLLHGGHDRSALKLTGPERLTLRERVAVAAEVTGEPLRVDPIGQAEAVARWRAAGHGDELIEQLIAWAIDPPASAYTPSSAVADVLGRRARTFREWAQEHARALLPGATAR